ncbi:cellulase family glycosylhydrolase [Terrilactibacillus sp. BCM23-1]|uniref:Cellulase family glycosylhydrolase n=2 Tax=Terrilactibacillus tamarindi TaxID=2599694 RepID=A0A6N8CT43_9BACI|nr:cellulase family glycosylhydrolase [Terrilactibacillus tamarindi]
MTFIILFIVIFLVFSYYKSYSKPREQVKAATILFKSINIGNALDAPRDFPWDVEMKLDYFNKIKEAGFDTVRLPVRFSDYAKNNPNNCLDEPFMKYVDECVTHALNLDLTVILDLHHFEEMMQEPEAFHECFLRIWEQLSVRYQCYSSKLIFEVLNEPKDQLVGELWNTYLAEAITIIRQTNPTRRIIVGPDNYYTLYRLDALRLPKDDHLIVSFHYYEPIEFTFQSNPYLGYSEVHDLEWEGTSKEIAYIKDRFKRVKRWADQHRVQIYLGEFGANNRAPYSSRLRWTKAICEQAEELGFSWGYWELASHFGINNAKTGEWDKEMLKVLLEKRSGDQKRVNK